MGRLVGIKARNFNIEDIEAHRKYMPLWYNKELYNYPKMMVAYGYYQNQKVIKKAKEVIVYEAEKSVLKHGSYFTQNKSIAIGGSSFSIYHAWILKQAGVEKIILALDNDWDEEGNKDYGLKKMIKEGYKIKDMGFDVELIYDWSGELLDNKDAPIDKGRQIYSKLYRERKNITEFANEATAKEEDGEIPVTQ
jgi:DNA primase